MTARGRLTLVYTGLVLGAGFLLLALTYVLLVRGDLRLPGGVRVWPKSVHLILVAADDNAAADGQRRCARRSSTRPTRQRHHR
ncbi:hypothetical protein [Micromonospora sp. NPDC005203]|uniref:hypothetical protein n=1 Tax=Micromonospora sp. NPDC005203 TaxID=3364226 RepID=UPI0036A82471